MPLLHQISEACHLKDSVFGLKPRDCAPWRHKYLPLGFWILPAWVNVLFYMEIARNLQRYGSTRALYDWCHSSNGFNPNFFYRSYLILFSNSILLTVFEVNLFQFFLGFSFFFYVSEKNRWYIRRRAMPSPYVDSVTSYTEDLKIVAYQILVLDPLGMGKIFALNIFFSH